MLVCDKLLLRSSVLILCKRFISLQLFRTSASWGLLCLFSVSASFFYTSFRQALGGVFCSYLYKLPFLSLCSFQLSASWGFLCTFIRTLCFLCSFWMSCSWVYYTKYKHLVSSDSFRTSASLDLLHLFSTSISFPNTRFIRAVLGVFCTCLVQVLGSLTLALIEHFIAVFFTYLVHMLYFPVLILNECFVGYFALI